MKKQYMPPCMKAVKMEQMQVLCGSSGGFDPDAMP